MKIEHVLRKAAPFLLIAILIACLFSMPQKEGMKGKHKHGAKHFFEKNHGRNIVGIAAPTVVGTGLAGWGYHVATSGAAEESTTQFVSRAAPAEGSGAEDLMTQGGTKTVSWLGGPDGDPREASLSERSTVDLMSPEAREVMPHSSLEFTSKAAKYDDGMDDVKMFRDGNMRTNEQGIRDAEDPKDFVQDVGKNPEDAAVWAGEHPEDVTD